MESKNNSTITYEYDALNRIKKAVLDKSIEIVYEYDAAGNIIQINRSIMKAAL